MDKYVEAEHRLAELQGHVGIFEFGGALIDENGTTLPKWARDDGDAFWLLVKHQVAVDPSAVNVIVRHAAYRPGILAHYADHPSKEAAVRYAIVQAVIAKLEGEKK